MLKSAGRAKKTLKSLLHSVISTIAGKITMGTGILFSPSTKICDTEMNKYVKIFLDFTPSATMNESALGFERY